MLCSVSWTPQNHSTPSISLVDRLPDFGGVNNKTMFAMLMIALNYTEHLLNTSKSISMIFKPVNKNRHLTCIFGNFVLGTDALNFVKVFKYLTRA